ncbi:DNA polymerase III subunit gamma/tau [Lentilactobacillus sp. SPB1-3]|uniref:DNA polymerase III subunit gamma/tau n=1 Tax=Lentilactobacillus terminaliae TaxID=3003483 RepID=A0ACD5DGA3_9LACO|nr:DNA polymerase III subunit gamma/tau [Lentilactobacillus sp. SPB1-3]MCZ0976914.1 DNA polymerase III subunit gamma/tau [Lentilactobacillus sp. SPB1-3]
MSYQALYRVWRPQRFGDLVGQEIITQTLKNALITGQTSHAYLFTGPRGTGKTSAAKIFAKAVNCHFLKDGEPCNECETCKAITDGSLNDVIEIDAASNNGVEEIRDIRDKAKYAPTIADYKVYIIDEVHMLSTGAFNALLKTLEEPPANVIFILATTEPHKIPATIISRTQRFDFKRIKPKTILERMEYILDQKGVTYEEKALKLIAKSAEGGMRDALSILDQAMSYGDNQITYDNALLVTGSVKNNLLLDYLQQVIAGQTKDALSTIQAILDDGKDPKRFVEDLTSTCQDLLLYKQDTEMVEELELGIVDDKFKQLSETISDEQIYGIVEVLNDVLNALRFTTNQDVYLEVLTVKLTHLPAQDNTGQASTAQTSVNQGTDYQDLMDTINSLQNQVADLTKKVSQQPSQTRTVETPVHETKQANATPAAKKSTDAKIELTKIYPILDSATRSKLNQFKQVWPDLMDSLSVTQRAVMHVSTPVAAGTDGVIVSFEYPFLFQKAQSDTDLKDALENGLDRIVGQVPQIVFVPENQWPSIRSDYLAKNGTPETSGSVNQKTTPAADESHTNDSQSSGDDEAPLPPEPANADLNENDLDNEPQNDSQQPNLVVQKAEELFGNEIVDVKND